jgi:anti-sigma regulatory factor (Ser/Thr protein kinase)
MTGDTPQQSGGEERVPGGGLPWEGSFPLDADAVRRGRVEVEVALRQAGVDERTLTDALLVLGELVSNAVRHACTEFTVSVAAAGEALRIEVFDGDSRPPALLGLDSESTSGRGLHIVAGIASDWGWRTSHDEEGLSGKRVWAEIPWEAPDAAESG